MSEVVLKFGNGTTVIPGAAEIKVLEKVTGHGYPRIEITQSVFVRATVLVCAERYCGICARLTPMPDAAAAEYILRNHDGGRIVFPWAEDVRDERDTYPVTGWRNVRIGDMEMMACPECQQELQKSVEKLRKAR